MYEESRALDIPIPSSSRATLFRPITLLRSPGSSERASKVYDVPRRNLIWYWRKMANRFDSVISGGELQTSIAVEPNRHCSRTAWALRKSGLARSKPADVQRTAAGHRAGAAPSSRPRTSRAKQREVCTTRSPTRLLCVSRRTVSGKRVLQALFQVAARLAAQFR